MEAIHNHYDTMDNIPYLDKLLKAGCEIVGFAYPHRACTVVYNGRESVYIINGNRRLEFEDFQQWAFDNSFNYIAPRNFEVD